MENYFEVIVIGAGISGIGASLELSNHNIRHLIIEGRDRIGGRITSTIFEGVQIQLGASYVHLPNQTNKIANIVREKGYKCSFANFDSSQCFYEGKGQIQTQKIQQAENYLQQLMQSASKSSVDTSLEEASQIFMRNQRVIKEQIKNIIKCDLNIFGDTQGSSLDQISARQCEESQSSQDLLPFCGYSNIVKDIYKECKAEIRFNQVVTKIDYSESIIKVYTKTNVYMAKKLISSLPLGVLQKNIIQFIPKLPERYTQALMKIGNGTTNKLFVNFEEPFWNNQNKPLKLVRQGSSNRYPCAVQVQGTSILCFFFSEGSNKQINEMCEEEIRLDLMEYLSKFNFDKQIRIKSIERTRWQKDPLSLGSYSFYKVGVTGQDINTLRVPINNKMWFVGQHCHPNILACAHAAFETGIWASEQVITHLQ